MENSYFKEIDAAALGGAVSGAYRAHENLSFRLSDFEKPAPVIIYKVHTECGESRSNTRGAFLDELFEMNGGTDFFTTDAAEAWNLYRAIDCTGRAAKLRYGCTPAVYVYDGKTIERGVIDRSEYDEMTADGETLEWIFASCQTVDGLESAVSDPWIDSEPDDE